MMTIQTVNKLNLQYDLDTDTGELSNFQPLTLSDQSAAIRANESGNIKAPGTETQTETTTPVTIPDIA